MLRPLAVLALTAAILRPAPALEVGAPVPWIHGGTILQHGPALEEPFALERYRGGVFIIIAWEEFGNASRKKEKVHEELAATALALKDDDVLVLGMAVDVGKITAGIGEDFGQRGPIIAISQEDWDSLGPHIQHKRTRILIGADGKARDVGNGQPPELLAAAKQALAERTPYGRWATLRAPWFDLISTVAKAAALQGQVNAGKVGSALTAARKLVDDDRDQALANEARFVVQTVETWIAKAQAIAADARTAGDLFTVGLVAEGMADLLRGAPEGDAAKDLLKTTTSDPAYKIGRSFHDVWRKTWGADPASQRKSLEAWLAKNGEGYWADQARMWFQ